MSNPIYNLVNKFFKPRTIPGGNVLQNTMAISSEGMPNPPLPDQQEVRQQEPYGSIPFHKLGRASGWSQLQNLSAQLDVAKVQAAFRSAERGDTTMLFGYYRDMFLGTGQVSSELSKRKLAVLSEPYVILPNDKTNQDDILAAKVIEDMIEKCPQWNDNLVHLMNAVLYPVAVSEKIFKPADVNDGINKFNIRYRLDRLSPVDYNLLCYRLAYLPSGPINPTNQPVVPKPPLIQSMNGRPEDTVYDVDSYEPDLRFWSVFSNGLINFSWSSIYAPDPDRHFIYRANLMSGIARDNFGGLGRSLLFWTVMAQQGREFFLRMMDRFGVPFIVAKVDTSQADTVTFLENAFQMSQKLGALMVNKDAEIDVKEIAMAGAADGHEKFMSLCNDQISLLICGQTLSSHAKGTGMGSGVAKLQGQVREDIKRYDQLMLGNALRTQLFTQYLRINGFTGSAPKILWGGSSPDDAKMLADTLMSLSSGGLEPSQDALEDISNRLGFEVQKLSSGDLNVKIKQRKPGLNPSEGNNDNGNETNNN